ncbi:MULTISPECIES: hypothetical protein [Calothrix]|uniref:PEP-CTERM protein-sorting domain-containing protein n=2 Tax=Calothrix TaxID=1186 RepID=A0ABR8A9W7_9CYAN|nr:MULTISPECIES: hypothetical protein [Calothrix]MBD2196742.1 hypothetical protein [Calothrix parietina FACHB-288]MBD2224158.1 hypothetical protein [Calothrix anomala FACHB-343]
MPLLPRSHSLWLLPIAVTLSSFTFNTTKAIAKTTYPFSANYDIFSTSIPITQNVSAASLSGESTDAPYKLNTINGLTYVEVDFATGFFRFNTDPTIFGLQDLPVGSIVFGSGINKLFGTDIAVGQIDFTTNTAKASGTFTITGGEGIFAGATGTLSFVEFDTLSFDPAIPTKARASVNGFIQTVPEPKTNKAIIAMGAIGVGVLLRHRRCYRERKILRDMTETMR